jgi:exodeoxyribonuclease X
MPKKRTELSGGAILVALIAAPFIFLVKTSITLDVDIWSDVVVDTRPKAVIRIVDLETTGLDPDDEVVEIGAVDLDVDTGDIRDVASRVVRPRKSIPPQASAIHHLTDVDVASAPGWSDVWPQVFTGGQNVIAFAAHNANFDSRWLTGDLLAGKPLICTYKAALRIWPNAPGHKNHILRYWLNLPVDRNRAIPTHRALPDAYVTAHLLRQVLTSASVDDLVSWSNQPAHCLRSHSESIGERNGRTYPTAILIGSFLPADSTRTSCIPLKRFAPIVGL